MFFDRSPACTLALSRYLGFPTSRLLADEVSRIVAEGTYEPMVFFIRNQGFVQPTAARQISFEDSLPVMMPSRWLVLSEPVIPSGHRKPTGRLH